MGKQKTHGLGLIALIRLCPFPYSYSNFFFASIQEVSPFQFFAATCTLGLKGIFSWLSIELLLLADSASRLFVVALQVYVGTRLYLFSDPEHREEMDQNTKILNTVSVIVSILLGAGVGAYVYRLTMSYVAEGEVALVDAAAEANAVDQFLQEEGHLELEEEGRASTGAVRPSEDWEGPFSDFDEGELTRKGSPEVRR